MASLRTATPRLRNYFKDNYIPQICEVLLCGILVTCPEDPLRYLEEMLMVIIENGLESLLWDMCIEPSMKPKIRRLSETYMEQLFGLDDQLMTPELMVKACTFYTGHLIKTHFCMWRDTAIPCVNESTALIEKMERAITYYNSKLLRFLLHLWHSYVKRNKENLIDTLSRLRQMFSCQRQRIILIRWRDKARYKAQNREDELILKHELQLRTWRNKLKSKVASDEKFISPEQSSSDATFVNANIEFDISILPEKAILRIFSFLSLKDMIICGQVNHSWMSMTQTSALWTAIDFSAIKSSADRCIMATLQRWRLNVLRLNFRGCSLRPKTLKAVSHCKNLQELNVSDCPSLTDESMRYISEGCPGVLYLNLSNTAITNKTMRLLPRHFLNLQNLSLAYCRRFTDKGLRYLSLGNGCHKLIYLDISGCTQPAYRIPEDVTALTIIKFNLFSQVYELAPPSTETDAKISVQGFRNIASSCTGLMYLTINDMPTLTDNCVKVLVEKCTHITSVVFIGSPHISDCAFNALSTCNLRKIRFEGNKRITDACFRYVDKNYPNINHIYMVDCKAITDGSLRSLSPLRHLTVLNLANCVRIGDIGLRQFLEGPSSIRIRELNLSNCALLGDASIVKLSERCPNLNYLSLRNCEHLTDQGLEYIVNIFSLISVDISGTVISNEGLLFLSRHKKLKELSISECYRITDYGIQTFCKNSPTLEHLDVSHCPQLSDEIMKTVAIYSTHLTSLSIAGCPKITDLGIEMLSAKCQYLHILDISGCILLTDQILEDLQIGCKQLRILKMQYCRQVSMRAAQRMSSVVEQQEYSSGDPPHWFGYDSNGTPLGDSDIIVKESYSSEEEANYLQPKARKHKM